MQVVAAGALAHLAVSSQHNRDAIAAAGAASALTALLRSEQSAVQDKAAGALKSLEAGTQPIHVPLVWKKATAGSQLLRDAIVAAGAVPLLVPLLRSDQPALQMQASGALWCLAHNSQQNRIATIAAGIVPLML